MVAQQRHAVFNLAIALAAFGFFIAMVPFFGLAKAQAGFALLGITAFGPLFLRNRPGQIVGDERDQSIFLRASQITFAIFWLLFVAGVMGTYYALRKRSAIPLEILPLGVWLAWTFLLVIHSTILLALYKRS